MKNLFLWFVIDLLLLTALFACKKKNEPLLSTTSSYTSLTQFRQKAGYAPVAYNIDGAAGGSFTSSKGTQVTVPASAFVTQSNGAVTGSVQLQLMDLYSKTDLVMGGLSTTAPNGTLMVSGGEFFIKATQNGQALQLAPAKNVNVMQPVKGGNGNDTMNAFIWGAGFDTTAGNNWQYSPSISNEYNNGTNIIFSLYQFHAPVDSGTWCNSDNASYFASYPNTKLTLNNATDTVGEADLFLVFSGANSMVHVYGGPSQFIYSYAPVGLQATIVAMGISKSSVLMASFTPITITANETTSFQMQPIADTALIAKLKQLN